MPKVKLSFPAGLQSGIFLHAGVVPAQQLLGGRVIRPVFRSCSSVEAASLPCPRLKQKSTSASNCPCVRATLTSRWTACSAMRTSRSQQLSPLRLIDPIGKRLAGQNPVPVANGRNPRHIQIDSTAKTLRPLQQFQPAALSCISPPLMAINGLRLTLAGCGN